MTLQIIKMKQIISLKPVKMTSSVMEDLEKKKLILRLGPRRHELPAKWGETLDQPVYDSHERWGPHRLLTVTVNRMQLPEFATHPDNEEFLLLGDASTKPLYIVIALMQRVELEKKIMDQSISPSDFICLEVVWNDPDLSFFTMLAGVPHGETITAREGRPPSFYVTEGRLLPNDLVDLGNFEISVNS
jgi:hypothetical protein